MPLRWFEADGTTPLGQSVLQPVGPGESYREKYDGSRQLVLKNTGPTTFTETFIEILRVSSFPTNEFARIATGETEPEPEEFVGYEDPPLELGELGVDDSVKVWVDLVVPLNASRGEMQHAVLDAYGSQT